MENDQLNLWQQIVKKWPFVLNKNVQTNRDIALRFHIGLVRLCLLNKYHLIKNESHLQILAEFIEFCNNPQTSYTIIYSKSIWNIILGYSPKCLYDTPILFDDNILESQEKIKEWCELLSQFLQLDLKSPFFNDLSVLTQNLQIDTLIKQKQHGAYYTPQKIASFMTRQTFFLFFSDRIFGIFNEKSLDNQILMDSLQLKINEIKSDDKFSASKFIQILEIYLNENDLKWIKHELIIILQKIQILDPSCGSGHFITEIINEWCDWTSVLCQSEDNLKIIFDSPQCQCVFHGWDIDPIAIDTSILRIQAQLLFIFEENVIKNFYWNNIYDFIRVHDSIQTDETKYNSRIDIILGNPPYLNLIENEPLRFHLSSKFPQIYHGKLDLCYYFLPLSYTLLNPNGILSFVLKRYFLKSPTAKDLRLYIKSQFQICNIVDFENQDIFEKAGIQTLLLSLRKRHNNDLKFLEKSLNDTINYFTINQSLKSGTFLEDIIKKKEIPPISDWKDKWITQNIDNAINNTKSLFEYTLIDYLSENNLKQNGNTQKITLFKLVKGIQTGKDSVFIIDKMLASTFESEKIRTFIKSSNIKEYYIINSDLSLILSHQYSPIIRDLQETLSEYPNINAYLLSRKNELTNRSRSKDNLWSFWRKGDERNTVDFSIPKLLWPYRGSSFRAAIDFHGYYHSQDIILLTLNLVKIKKYISFDLVQSLLEDWSENGVYFYLGIFNSPVFQKILYTTAKEFAKDVKDFQPNNFNDIPMPLWNCNNPIHAEIIDLSRKIHNLYSQHSMNYEIIQKFREKIDQMVHTLFYSIASSSVEATG